MKARQLPLCIITLGLMGITLTEAQHPPGFETKPFQFQREIMGTPGGMGLGTVILDPEIYLHSGQDHGKLRLVRKEEERFTELPWIITPVEQPESPGGERHIPHRIESFDETEDGSIELTVVLLGETPPPVRLEILTPLRDFEKSVTVSETTDGIAWTPIVNDGLVFDYARFLDFRRTSLVLPGPKSRRFKVRISDATDQQRSLVKELSRTVSDATGVSISESGTVKTRLFRIDEIRFFSAPTKRGKNENEQTYGLKILEQKQNRENKTTEILLDGGWLPIREVTLSMKDRNFRREVSVQIPDETTTDGWRTIQRGNVHCYHVGDFHEEWLSVRFTEARCGRYRVVIENEDSSPLTIDTVTGKGDVYELLFLAGAGDRCSLFLGSPDETMTRPRFDSAAIVAAKNQKVKREYFELGNLTDNKTFSADLPPDPRLFESKGLLWSIIVLVVALLIFVLYRTMQQVEAVKDEI